MLHTKIRLQEVKKKLQVDLKITLLCLFFSGQTDLMGPTGSFPLQLKSELTGDVITLYHLQI